MKNLISKLLLLTLIIFSQTQLHSMFSNFNKLKTLSKTKFILQPKTNLPRKFTRYSDVKIETFDDETFEKYCKMYGEIDIQHPYMPEEIKRTLVTIKTMEIILKSQFKNQFELQKKYQTQFDQKQDIINSEQTRELAEIKSLLKEFIKNRDLENKKLLKIKSLLKRGYYVSSPEDAVKQYIDTLYEIEQVLDEKQ